MSKIHKKTLKVLAITQASKGYQKKLATRKLAIISKGLEDLYVLLIGKRWFWRRISLDESIDGIISSISANVMSLISSSKLYVVLFITILYDLNHLCLYDFKRDKKQ